ncbi:helix-turn-helix transcriptional regulator [uncultured Hymenobacter sp.]|uniref:helix-turn-helix transcriptional regulator n=1 Tax=uncultured Hymenobacter sp. TaxID=170016 RepID=UPI0035CC2A51
MQFIHDFLGNAFFSKAELPPVEQLLRRSASGLQFEGCTPAHVQPRPLQLAQEPDPLRRLRRLLDILQHLASAEGQALDPQPRSRTLVPAERARYHRVMTYLVDHFRERITLAQAASVAGLIPNAFCKYCKALTRKTIIETVVEYRLQYAAEQLTGTGKPVAEICYDSGFGNVSRFNKTFKAQLQHTPLRHCQAFRAPLPAA